MMNRDSEYFNKGIDSFRKSKILVIGDIMLDQFIWGKVSRISPEAPVPVVGVERETAMLGGAANVVNNIVSIGGNVLLCGCVGDDSPGKEIVSKLNELDVDIEGIIIEAERPTTVKTRIIAHAQQVVRYDREREDSLKPESAEEILRFIDEKKEDLAGIIVSDYGKGIVSSRLMNGLKEMIAHCDIPVTVDPSVKNFSLYRDLTIITPNHHQAGAIAGMESGNEGNIEQIGEALLSNGKSKAVLITRGAEGMSLFEQDGNVTHIKSMARKVYDVTGAGDTVIAILTLGIAGGLDIKSAAYLSNLAAGLVVGEVGTSAVKVNDLKGLVDSHFLERK